jgi:hypothetical protein
MFKCGREHDVILGPKAVAEEESLSTDQRQTRKGKEGSRRQLHDTTQNLFKPP